MEAMGNWIMQDIRGYEGKYAISNNGMVWSYQRKKWLKPLVKAGSGYLFVDLGSGYQPYIHRLVAEAFIPPFGENERELTVDHINRDRTDNRAENLQWVSQADNVRKDCARPVVEHAIGRPNAVIGVYGSINMAALLSGADRKTIKAHCAGELKNKSLQRFRFATEEEAMVFQYRNKKSR